MTPNEQSFISACLASPLSEENQAQWNHYRKLTDATEKTAYAETVVEKWNRILVGSEFEYERGAGQLPPGWHKLIPRGAKETDPTGRSSKDPGAKLDAGKVRMGLVLGGFANALMEVSKVGTFGAAKYSDNGWKQVPNAEARYTDALLRHVFKHMRGEEIDPEWGLPHLAHAAWGCLAVLEKMLERQRSGEVPLTAWSEITIKRPIGGSPEQAAPLKEFTPLPGTYMTLAGEVTPWENLMRDGACVIKRYEAKHCYTRGDQILLTCVDHGVDGKQSNLISFSVDWTREDVRKRVEDPISFFSNLVGKKLSDHDFAIFTGRIKQNEGR